jgi:hypothetical protein
LRPTTVPYHHGSDWLLSIGALQGTYVPCPESLAVARSLPPFSSGVRAANGGERPVSPGAMCPGGAPRSALCG